MGGVEQWSSRSPKRCGGPGLRIVGSGAEEVGRWGIAVGRLVWRHVERQLRSKEREQFLKSLLGNKLLIFFFVERESFITE